MILPTCLVADWAAEWAEWAVELTQKFSCRCLVVAWEVDVAVAEAVSTSKAVECLAAVAEASKVVSQEDSPSKSQTSEFNIRSETDRPAPTVDP